MDIKKFLKPGKDMIIDINEVEYLLNDAAVASIERGDKKINLIQLFDHQHYLFDHIVIIDSIEENGIIDYLDKKS